MSQLLHRARFLMERSKYEQAEEELRLAIHADPKDARAHGMMALTQLSLGDLDSAHHEAMQALFHDEEASFTQFVMARVAFHRGEPGRAEAHMRRALVLDDQHAEYHAYLAGMLYEQGRWKEARAAAEEGLARDPGHLFCRNIHALSLTKMGEKTLAGVELEQVLKDDPDSALAHANRGYICLQYGKPEKALVSFRSALRLDPGLEWARMGLMDAMKARHVVYRVLLKMFYALSRTPPLLKWLLVLGLFAGNRVLFELGEVSPTARPFARILNVAYAAIVFLSWAGGPLFNLVLRFDRFGRYVLNPVEKAGGLWTAGLLAGGGLLLSVGWGFGWHNLQVAGAGLLIFVVPIGGLFSVRDGMVRSVLGGYVFFLAVMLGCAITVALTTGPLINFFAWIYLGGVVLFGWVANIVSQRM